MSKLALRRFWFQVHKWIGLILAVLIIPLSLTGAGLVWDDVLDHHLNPQRYTVSGDKTTNPQSFLDAARRVLKPGETIVSVSVVEGGPVVIAASQAGQGMRSARGGPMARTTIWLDPPTARVLDVQRGNTGLIRVMHNIHGQLMVPGVGRQIVGWIGVAMAFSCFTGLWLWWPTVGAWVRGLRWRRHRNLDTNLHHLLGFWIALPLFVLSATGVWVAFPQMVGSAPPRSGGTARPAPLAVTGTSLDKVIAGVQSLHAGRWQQIAWPTDKKPIWDVTIAGTQAMVSVDDATGVAVMRPSPPETTARLMRRIHDGTRMGPVWQTIIFVGGVLPAILSLTGIIMWWRARRWRAALATRRCAQTFWR